MQGKAIAIKGSYASARSKMIEMFGVTWAFQYSYAEWKQMQEDQKRFWALEDIVQVIEED